MGKPAESLSISGCRVTLLRLKALVCIQFIRYSLYGIFVCSQIILCSHALPRCYLTFVHVLSSTQVTIYTNIMEKINVKKNGNMSTHRVCHLQQINSSQSTLNVAVAVDINGITRLPRGILHIIILEVVGNRMHGHVAFLAWCAGWEGLTGCMSTCSFNISLDGIKGGSAGLTSNSIWPGEDVAGCCGGRSSGNIFTPAERPCGERGDGGVGWGGETLAGGVQVGVGRCGVESLWKRRHLFVEWPGGVSDVDWVVHHWCCCPLDRSFDH